MKPGQFRTELKKLMPGYRWTVHQTKSPEYCLSATGIMTSGMNRTSTLAVTWSPKFVEASSSGYGVKGPWMGTGCGETVAQALRSLQDQYEAKAANYNSLVAAMGKGRQACSKS